MHKMPWFFAIPEFLKKRACRYLLQHYLGQYLEEKISLEDLTLDLYSGTGAINNVSLNVEAINEALQGTGAPVKVVRGSIGQVTVSVPWTALMRDSCCVKVSGLTLTVVPHLVPTTTEEFSSMTDSLFFSMTSSHQLAEEVIRSGPSPGEGQEGVPSAFEGMEALARAIELVLARVQVALSDVTVQVNYLTPDYTQEHFLKLRIKGVEFYDELSRQESSVDVEGEEVPKPAAVAVKMLKLSGLTLELGSRAVPGARDHGNYDDTLTTTLSPPAFSLSLHPSPSLEESEGGEGVPVAVGGGDVSVRVKIRQSDTVPGPKLEVEGVLGSVHLLLSPMQLQTLVEMATGIATKATSSSSSGVDAPHPGQNRPIPGSEMGRLESQLRHHVKEQRQKRQQREELLRADPWENSLRGDLLESTYSSTDEFFQLDLNTSYSGHVEESSLEDSFVSAKSRSGSIGTTHIHGRCVASEMESIPFHTGAGLQQLSQSPPFPKSHSPPLQRVHSTTNVSNTASNVRSQRQSDSQHDVCKYTLTVSGITVALLEADPTYIYSTPGVQRTSSSGSLGSSAGSDGGSMGQYCSLDEGGLDPMKYFEGVASCLKGGVNRRVVQGSEEKLGQILPADHLFLWLSTVQGGVVMEGAEVTVDLSVASSELWERLYHNQANLPNINRPVSTTAIAQFTEDSVQSRPCLRMRLSTGSEPSRKKSHGGSPEPHTSIELSLASVHVNADITLLDRLQPLLTSPLRSRPASLRSGSLGQMKHSLYMTPGNIHTVKMQRQAVFNQAVSAESSARREQRVSLRVNCHTLDLSLRFPVPDLRGARQPPWFHPSLRPEVLYTSLSNVSFLTLLHPSVVGPSSYDLQFTSAKAYLSVDGSPESRVLFLTVGDQEEGTGEREFNKARLSVVVQPVSGCVLEEAARMAGGGGKDSGPYPTLEEVELPSRDPSPFSRLRNIVSTLSKEEGDSLHSEELVMPGSPQEMAEFEQHASPLSHLSLSASLPSLHLHLPSKTFLQTLYSRFGNDLLLWKPATPAAVEKANTAKSMFLSCMDVIQPAVSKEERYRLCKSAIREEDSDEEEDYDEVAQLVSSMVQVAPSPSSSLSQLSLSLTIDAATLSMITVVEPAASSATSEEGLSSVYASASSERLVDLSPRQTVPAEQEHGLVLAHLSNVHLFTVSGYLGDPTHNYCCAQVQELSVHHIGSLESQGLPLYSCTGGSPISPFSPHLLPMLHRSEEGARLRADSAGESHDLPMIAVAMEMRLDTKQNSKTTKCAVALHNTTVRYHMTPMGHSCFKQLGEFFTVVEEAVPGYDPPSSITELHTHLQDCAVEYRPLYLPLRMLLTLDSVSLSTTVVAGSPLLVVRLVLDGTRLFLSNKQEDHVNLRHDYVCVLEVDWLGLTLRLCKPPQEDTQFHQALPRCPELSVECGSNRVQLWTCLDSCVALRDLLVYLAANSDLRPPETAPPPFLVRDYSSLGSDPSPLSSLNSHSGSPPLGSLANGDIGELISEAMEDVSHHEGPVSTTRESRRRAGGSRARRRGTEGARSKLQVHVSNEKSIHMVFDSDSDEDGDGGKVGGVLVQVRGGGGGVQSPRAVFSGSEQGSMFSGSDDDFCILDAPTTTKVAPGARPVVKPLLEEGEKLDFIENYFTVPDRTDQLQRPKHFPEPVFQYTLKEMSIVWHLYGGSDFAPPPHNPSPSPSPGSSPSTARKLPTLSPYTVRSRQASASSSTSPGIERKFSSGPKFSAGVRPVRGRKAGEGKGGRGSCDWMTAGGPCRDHSVLMEMELDKVQIQHETYPLESEQASRLVVLVRDLEVRDRLVQSNINKFLHQHTTEARPRQSHANMVSLKVVFSRPELETDPSIEEASLHLSLLPIRLNIDQDAVFFLYEFFKHLTDIGSINLPPSTIAPHPPSLSEGGEGAHTPSPDHAHSEVFVRSFIFHPALPIRIDYQAKGFHTEAVGTLAGILLGLSHLDCSEVTLKSLHFKKGLLGWNEVAEYASSEWAEDVRRYQLPLILKGVGPMHHVTQFVYGFKNLLWLPVEQYREDGRIMRGLQRGASSFSISTGGACVELANRFLQTVQSMAQMAYDLVTPMDQRVSSQALQHQHRAPHQPLDFREGVANAYDVVTAGFGGMGRDLVNVAAQEHEERGVTGAVGGVLRQLPGAIIARPIVFLSEASRHVLGGVKNQFVPDARKEASEKWRTNESND